MLTEGAPLRRTASGDERWWEAEDAARAQEEEALVHAEHEASRFAAEVAAGNIVVEQSADVPYWLQADPSLNSVSMLRKRYALRHHSLVLAALDECGGQGATHTHAVPRSPRCIEC